MKIDLGSGELLEALRADEEFCLAARNLDAVVRLQVDEECYDMRIVDGLPVKLAPATGPLWTARLGGTLEQWQATLRGDISLAVLGSGFEGVSEGVSLDADFLSFGAPYGAAVRRLVRVAQRLHGLDAVLAPMTDYPFESTDSAVGRYLYIDVRGVRYRVYYEESGEGTPLLLQHTAGADSRQWRHFLADPQMQQKYRMIAYDLPFHGRSLPPLNGPRWWEQEYAPTKHDLLATVVAIKAALRLDRPIFMGVSVGGQLATDLLAHHADEFMGAVSINGWYHTDHLRSVSNAPFHHPMVSPEFWGNLMYEATSPRAPEALRRESAWIYASNGPAAYKGDNEYFTHGHDLRVDGHLIDTQRTPLYAVAGEFDPAFSAPGGTRDIADNIPGAKYVALEGLSHFAMSDDPVAFNAAIKPVLEELVAHGSAAADVGRGISR